MPRQTEENGADVEITPEMIEAGIESLCQCDFQADEYKVICSNVYRAMARLKPDSQAFSYDVLES